MGNTALIRAKIQNGDDMLASDEYYQALKQYLDAASKVVTKNWEIPVREKIHSLLSADINDDGETEILYGTEGNLLSARRHDSSELWSFRTNNWVTGIGLVQNSVKEKRIIVASDMLYILDVKGNCIKRKPLKSSASSLALYCSENFQGLIVVGEQSGDITIFNLDLEIVGDYKTGDKVIDLAVGDFDEDGMIEIAAASEDRYVYLINERGVKKDKFHVNHWIVNMDCLRLGKTRARLYIGEFQGVTHVYKSGGQFGKDISLSSILDLKVCRLFDDIDQPQFIVGASDRQLSIFDYNGMLIWSFESGLGQRALCFEKTGDGELDLFVGTESGKVYFYSIQLFRDLVPKIRKTFHRLNMLDLMDVNVGYDGLKVLKNFIEYNPINESASLKNSEKFSNNQEDRNALISAIEVWWNSCEYIWNFKTKGRVYDITFGHIPNNLSMILAGSEDGSLYCVEHDNSVRWNFISPFGRNGEVRGVFVDKRQDNNVFLASADNSLYKVSIDGVPLWNFTHSASLLYVVVGYTTNGEQIIIAGTEDHKILALNSCGNMLWQCNVGGRVRALSFYANICGRPCVVAGSDDCGVYIIDCSTGTIENSFRTPHYVLVVNVQDINSDGVVEILTGNENGHLHVYSLDGSLLWRFETGSWVAALDVFEGTNGEKEIILGSQDNNIYALDNNGAILWQYETFARVRTLSVDSANREIAFGSYDKCFYLLRAIESNFVEDFIKKMYNERRSKVYEGYEKSDSRYERAFFYINQDSISKLQTGLHDPSEIVIAASAYKIIEFLSAMNQDSISDLKKIMVSTSRRVRAIFFRKLNKLVCGDKILKKEAFKLIRDIITSNIDSPSKVDAFRHWLSISTSASDVFSMAKYLLPLNREPIDSFIIDELNHACIIASNYSDMNGENILLADIAVGISQIIKEQHPITAERVQEIF